MKLLHLDTPSQLEAIKTFFASSWPADAHIRSTVESIIREVREKGDSACLEYIRKFDGLSISAHELEVSQDELAQAVHSVSPELLRALHFAAENIRQFHEKQRLSDWQILRPGVRLQERVIPIERVGVYVPGGRARYPSTVLMTVIPARIAGVRDIIMVSPPDRETGAIAAELLAAAQIAGVDRIFKIGGAQAVAALAFGTESIPAVDKIVGPGNAYVAEAKRQLFGTVGIDMIAGPTELAVLTDGSASPLWIVQDLFAQMEHDPMTRTMVVSTEKEVLEQIQQIALQEMESKPRSQILQQAWDQATLLVQAAHLDLAVEAVNTFAPEHLQLFLHEPHRVLPGIRNAAAIFIGPFSPAALGDYVAGPNHTLPTGGCARYASALGVYDFVKIQHIVEYDAEACRREGAAAEILAEQEQLFNHALSLAIRHHQQK